MEPEETEPIAPETDTPDEPELMGRISVQVDKVMRPGTLVSGNVTFSDGVNAAWQLDPSGRIRLIPSNEGYKPSPKELQEFQKTLKQELQKSG